MNTATLIKSKTVQDTGAKQEVYRLSPPAACGWKRDKQTEHVCVSAVSAMYTGPETYIFACDENGHITDWSEMKGSIQGSLNHKEALRLAGYIIVPCA